MTAPFAQFLEDFKKEQEKIGHHQPHNILLASHMVRRNHLKRLFEYRNRNIIAYYSGWLHRAGASPISVIADRDFKPFSNTLERLDTSIGLDLVLHTPGGDVAATEKLVNFLLEKFDSDIEIFVPQSAMSAGTMIACAAKRIHMGRESSLGAIDPLVDGHHAYRILADYKKAVDETSKDKSRTPLWQAVLGKYPPGLILRCLDATEWSKKLTKKWLTDGAFAAHSDADARSGAIANELSDPTKREDHSRHIGIEEAKELGLNVASFEEDEQLKKLVEHLHLAYDQSLRMTHLSKIIENHTGTIFAD